MSHFCHTLLLKSREFFDFSLFLWKRFHINRSEWTCWKRLTFNVTQILIKTFIFFRYKTPVEIFVFDSRSKKFLNDLNGFYECLIVLNVLNVCVSPVDKNFVTKRIFKMWQNSFLPILEFIPIALYYFDFCNPCHKSCHILQNQNVTKLFIYCDPPFRT